MKNRVVDISKKTFISVIIILGILIISTIILTYIIPRGQFLESLDDQGNVIIHFDEYIRLENQSGINIFKGIFAPFLVLTGRDSLSIIMLSLFLLIVSGSFQVMNDSNGMKIIVLKLINSFRQRQRLLIAVIVLIFMIFGAFFGLFEETLTLLPIIIILTLSLGYDSYTGFLICIVATGFGFASAITNPFTVIVASSILGVSPVVNIWYRLIIFVIMYSVLLIFIFSYLKKIEKRPEYSPTYLKDIEKRKALEQYVYQENQVTKRTFYCYVIFLLTVLITIITITSIDSLRDYIIVFLIGLFLIGGLLSGLIATRNYKLVFTSFLKGLVAALPVIVMIAMAASIKYILEEGYILATITNSISYLVAGKTNLLVALIILGIILVLEFFISSSTAKAFFVMGILSGVSLGLSKELLVLIYSFGDGYTNVLFPTSPVLLIALSMTGMSYATWLKKSKWLFLVTLILIVLFIFIGIWIKY